MKRKEGEYLYSAPLVYILAPFAAEISKSALFLYFRTNDTKISKNDGKISFA